MTEVTEDFVSVIRCRNCKHYSNSVCKRFGIQISRKPEDFCSEGVRRDAEKTSLPL